MGAMQSETKDLYFPLAFNLRCFLRDKNILVPFALGKIFQYYLIESFGFAEKETGPIVNAKEAEEKRGAVAQKFHDHFTNTLSTSASSAWFGGFFENVENEKSIQLSILDVKITMRQYSIRCTRENSLEDNAILPRFKALTAYPVGNIMIFITQLCYLHGKDIENHNPFLTLRTKVCETKKGNT